MQQSRRQFIKHILSSSTAVSLYSNQIVSATSTNTPNILFIAVDDLRPALGCYGDPYAQTPNIDKLAKGGLVLNRAYCQQAVCNPSRSSLMTGRRPNSINVIDNQTHFRKKHPHIQTLPQYFKQNGYHACAIGKIYHDPDWAQDPDSWSEPAQLAVTRQAGGKYVVDANVKVWEKSIKATASECVDVPDDAYIDGRVANLAIEKLNEIKNKHFFLAVGFRRPHLPFSAPKKYWDLYDREKLAIPENPKPPVNVPQLALHNWPELRGYTDIPAEGALSPEKTAELRHGYYASTSYVDAQIGLVLDELNRLKLTDNTIVVLWGDHGWHLGEHDLWTKTTNFELDTRAPLIISVPDKKYQGLNSDALVEFVDIYPTLLDLCGFYIPEDLEGLSFKPVFENPDQEWKTTVFSQFPRPWHHGQSPEVMGYSMRTHRYRYTEWRGMDNNKVVARELYDHQTDPAEMINLAEMPGYESLIQHLSDKLAQGWQAAIPRGYR
jgi:iduronate 2-sulfatase